MKSLPFSSTKFVDQFWEVLLSTETGPAPIYISVSMFCQTVSMIADYDFLAAES